ncbi:MAG: hypothetical protein HQL15_08695, partial [Candidatus Omnitrophica bacterium]|nr:hypothetical protein [Candidatus Omnitrophota bacterium]
MIEFFKAQMDYVFFVYGLAFILLGVTSYFIFQFKQHQDFWKYICLFGVLHGISEWLDMLCLSTGDSNVFKIIRIVLMMASFLCLFEIIRRELQRHQGRMGGIWVYVPLLSFLLILGWKLDGLTGINILSRYVIGVVGGLLAAWVIASSEKFKDRSLSTFAIVLGGYSLTLIWTPKGSFLPSLIINQETFLSACHFPIQILRMLLGLILASLLWRDYLKGFLKILLEKEDNHHYKKGLWFTIGLALILLVGWFCTNTISRIVEEQDRDNLIDRVKVAAEVLDPLLIKSLSGTPDDLKKDHYQTIQQQLINILKGQPEIIYAYLFGHKEG